MKKLILLLIIPIFTYSQTYNELMGIESINDFKRVMIENGYEMDLDNDTKVMFGYNLVGEGHKKSSEKWAWYFKESKVMMYQFNETLFDLFNRFGDYDDIVDNIKSKCEYYDILVEDNPINGQYVGYICSESKLDGKFGFMVTDESGMIIFYPNNH